MKYLKETLEMEMMEMKMEIQALQKEIADLKQNIQNKLGWVLP